MQPKRVQFVDPTEKKITEPSKDCCLQIGDSMTNANVANNSPENSCETESTDTQYTEDNKSDKSTCVQLDKKDIDLILRRNSLTPDLVQNQKTLVCWSIVCICVGNSLASSGRLSLMNSITSLIEDDDLALVCLSLSSVVQFCTAIGGLFLRAKKKVINIKWMVFIASVLGSLQTVAFYYPTWPMLISTSVALGLGKSLFASSSFAYCNMIGYWYNHLLGGNLTTTLVLVSGLIHASVYSGFLWGNLFMYLILDPGSLTNPIGNGTTVCGIDYCNEDLSGTINLRFPPIWKYNTLISVFTVMAVVGIAIITFMDDFSDKLPSVQCEISPKYWTALKETWSLITEPKKMLLAVITIFIGLEHSFLIGTFTKAFIGCSLGIPNVGLVMTGYGISLIVTGSMQWYLVKFVGRIVVVLSASLLFLLCFFGLLFLPTTDYTITFFYVIVMIYGSAESMVMGVLASLYAMLFERNMAVGTWLLSFWRSLGMIVAFSSSPLLCTNLQLYILISAGGLGLIFYLTVEIILIKNKKSYNLDHPNLGLSIMTLTDFNSFRCY